MRRLLSLLVALLALPCAAAARDGLFIWADDAAGEVRMITFAAGDPNTATGLVVLERLKPYSETMTAVASDGRAVGLCHQRADGNESPASITGFTLKGRMAWEVFPRELHGAINRVLGDAQLHQTDPSWFTFSCADGGAAGKAGVLAFDIGVTVGTKGTDGYSVPGSDREATVRLHLAGKSGKLLGLALMGDAQTLRLERNPAGREQGAQFGFPDGGRGRVTWGREPILWQGKPVVEGHDFAWWLPPLD